MTALVVVLVAWAGVASLCAFLFWLLAVPKRRPPRHGRPREGASGRRVPPACPLGLPLTAAIVGRLVDAGFTPREVHAWWWRSRAELDGATPREAVLHGGSRWVLELAARDAACVAAEWEVTA